MSGSFYRGRKKPRKVGRQTQVRILSSEIEVGANSSLLTLRPVFLSLLHTQLLQGDSDPYGIAAWSLEDFYLGGVFQPALWLMVISYVI